MTRKSMSPNYFKRMEILHGCAFEHSAKECITDVLIRLDKISLIVVHLIFEKKYFHVFYATFMEFI